MSLAKYESACFLCTCMHNKEVKMSVIQSKNAYQNNTRDPPRYCGLQLHLIMPHPIPMGTRYDIKMFTDAICRHLYVPVRDVRGVFYQCSDDTTQGEKTLVDITSLPRSFVHCSRPPYVLTSSQIHLILGGEGRGWGWNVCKELQLHNDKYCRSKGNVSNTMYQEPHSGISL